MKDYKISRAKFFTTEERQQLKRYVEGQALLDRQHGRKTWQIRWILVHLAMHSGLRVSEIAGLKIIDIYISSKQPYIYVRKGKRGKARDVYIDRNLVKHLRQFIREKRTLWGQQNDPEAHLFTGQSGGAITSTALTLSFTEARRMAGLREGLSIHSARHTYATLLYSKTQNLRYVQKQLGHSTPAMTALYADIMPEENASLANKILD